MKELAEIDWGKPSPRLAVGALKDGQRFVHFLQLEIPIIFGTHGVGKDSAAEDLYIRLIGIIFEGQDDNRR